MLATAMSLIQEGVMLKAERMKKKMGLGKSAKVVIETVTVKERVNRDSNGMFVGLGFDSVDPVENLGDEEQAVSSRPGSGLSNALTEVTDTELSDLPGQVEDVQIENDEAIAEEPDNNEEVLPENLDEDEMVEETPEDPEQSENANDDNEETAELDDEMD